MASSVGHDHDHQRRSSPSRLRRRPDDLGRLGADLPQELAGIDSRHACSNLRTKFRHEQRPQAAAPAHAGSRPGLVDCSLEPRPSPAQARNGRSGGTRTHGPRFWRPMLYQLSYTPRAGARVLSERAPGQRKARVRGAQVRRIRPESCDAARSGGGAAAVLAEHRLAPSAPVTGREKMIALDLVAAEGADELRAAPRWPRLRRRSSCRGCRRARRRRG